LHKKQVDEGALIAKKLEGYGDRLFDLLNTRINDDDRSRGV